jgi:hypothetical protein
MRSLQLGRTLKNKQAWSCNPFMKSFSGNITSKWSTFVGQQLFWKTDFYSRNTALAQLTNIKYA